MFQIGELILYGNTGVCRIEAIGPRENTSLADQKKEYYKNFLNRACVFGRNAI